MLAGCGGEEARTAPQTVRGAGYVFAAPAGWEVVRSGRTASATSGDDSVSVTRFRLGRPYARALDRQVTAELDRVVRELAARLDATVAARTRPTIAGRRSWRYDLAGAGDGTHRIAFVLVGRSEYQLLCRREDDGAGDDACRLLFASFRLT